MLLRTLPLWMTLIYRSDNQMDKTTLNIEGDQRLVLVEAYTNPVKGESHHAPTYAYKWILNKASAFSEKVVGLGFD